MRWHAEMVLPARGGPGARRGCLAYFDASGKLGQLKSYSDQDLEVFRRFKATEYAIPTSLLGDYALLHDCGYLSPQEQYDERDILRYQPNRLH
jgi:hypothetical protein